MVVSSRRESPVWDVVDYRARRCSSYFGVGFRAFCVKKTRVIIPLPPPSILSSSSRYFGEHVESGRGPTKWGKNAHSLPPFRSPRAASDRPQGLQRADWPTFLPRRELSIGNHQAYTSTTGVGVAGFRASARNCRLAPPPPSSRSRE